MRHDAQHNSAVEVAQCIASGQRESPLRPLADTVPTLQALDEVRRHVGFGTPG